MYKHISSYLLRLARRSRMRKLDELVQNAYRPREQLRRQQESAFLRLIEHARINVPYYREILKGTEVRSLDDIASIPFLTKREIRGHLGELKAENIPAKRFIPNSTGGSTGEKLEFYGDTNQMLAALLLRSNTWTGWEAGERQMQLWGAHYDISRARGFINNLKTRRVQRNLLFSSYDMTDRDMAGYVETINRFKPALITGYPSAMTLFSEYIRGHGLDVHKPKGIVTSAETLYEHQRRTIESVFHCKVFNRYGCREAGGVAQECGERNGLHLFSEHVILEIVDEQGRRCEPGDSGEIVLTVLDNYAFPFIRYRVGDIGVLSDRSCPCGRNLPLIDRIEGRVFDIVVGTNGNHLSGTYWTILLREHIVGISRFQVVQEDYGRLLLRLVVDDRFDEGERTKLIESIKDKCGRDMIVDIERVDEVPLTESGKHRFVISKVSPYPGGGS